MSKSPLIFIPTNHHILHTQFVRDKIFIKLHNYPIHPPKFLYPRESTLYQFLEKKTNKIKPSHFPLLTSPPIYANLRE